LRSALCHLRIALPKMNGMVYFNQEKKFKRTCSNILYENTVGVN